MKRKFVLMILITLVTFVLAGCDFFGGNTTTTTTTTTPTTTTTTTTTGTTTTTSGTTTTTTTSGVTTTTTTTHTTTTTTATTTTTGTTTTTSTTTSTTTTTETGFDRQDLIDYFIDRAGGEPPTSEEIEAQIDFYQAMMGVSEEELYHMMMAVDTLMVGFNTMETLQDIQDLYNQAISLGFDRDTVINLMVNLFKQMLEQQLNGIDLSYYPMMIAEEEANKLALQAQAAALEAEVATYCTLTSTVATDCANLYEYGKQRAALQQQMWDLVDQYNRDWDQYHFEWYVFDDLRYYQDQIFYYTYEYYDEGMVNQYQGYYDETFGYLSPEEQAMYGAAIQRLIDHHTYDYTVFRPLEQSLYNVTDLSSNNVGETMNNYIWGYEDLQNQLRESEWRLEDYQRWAEQDAQEFAILTAVTTYFDTANGTTQLTLLAGTLYDVLNAVVLNFDQDTFDLIMSFITGEIVMGPELLTSENLVEYTGMVHDLLVLLQSTVDQSDIDNIKNLAKSVIPLILAQTDMDPEDLTFLLGKVDGLVDQYVGALVDAYDEVVGFIGSVDTVKADAIIAFIDLMTSGYVSETEMIIASCGLFTTILGDGSIDPEFIVNTLTEIYFDVAYQLNPDEADVLLVKAAFLENVNRIIELAGIIKDFDPAAITSEQQILMEELKARGDAIGKAFQFGLEYLLEPISWAYEHQDFLDLIYNLSGYWITEEEAEAQIQMFITLFGDQTEEETYYLLRSVLNYGKQIQSLSSFTEFQNWIMAVNDLGFSNEEIAGYLLSFLRIQLDHDVNDNGDLEYWQGELQNALDGLAQLQLDQQAILDAVEAAILALPAEKQQAAWDYWNAMVTHWNYNQALNETVWESYNYIESWMVDGMRDSWWNYLYFTAQSMPTQAEDMYNNFYNLFNQLSPEQQMYIDAMRNAEETLYNFQNIVLANAEQALMADLPTYGPFVEMVNTVLFDYFNFFWQIDQAQWWVDDAQNQVDWILEKIAEQEAFLEYVNDPLNETLILDVITIALDEVQHVVAAADPATFDIIFQLLIKGMKVDHEVSLYAEYEENPYDPFAEIDLSPLAIVGYAEDISAVIQAMFDLMTPENVETVKTLVLDLLEIQLTNEGYTELEIADIMAEIDTLFPIAWNGIQEVAGVLTGLLDGLTEANVQLIIDNIGILTDNVANTPEEVIAVSQLIDVFIGGEILDVQTLLDNYILVYYIVQYGPTYDTVAADAIKAIFQGYITDLVTLAATIATYDPATLDSLQLANIFEAMNLAQYIVESLMDPENIQAAVDMGYSHEDFVYLVDMMFKMDGDSVAIENQISMFVTLFNMTEEETYYHVMMYGQMIMSVRNIQSVEDAQAWILSVLNSGLTKQQIASLVVDALVMAYNQAASDYSPVDWLADLEQDYDDAQLALSEAQALVQSIDDEVSTHLSGIVDPSAQALAYQTWNDGQMMKMYDDEYWNTLNWASEDWLWQWGIYDELFGYYFGDGYNPPNMDAFNSRYEELPWDEANLYWTAISAYQNFATWQNYFYNDLNQLSFLMLTGPDGMMPLDAYLSNILELRTNTLHDINNLQWQLGDLEWQIRDAENQARMFTAFGLFIADAENIDQLKLAVAILLDEVENIALNVNPDTIYFILGLGNKEFSGEGMTITEMVDKVHEFGALVGLLMGTMDTADEAVIQDVIGTFMYDYINAFGDSEAMALALVGVFDNYFSDAIQIVPTISIFLNNMTEARLQTILDQIQTLNSVGDDKDNLSNFIRAVAIANLMEAVLADPVIDTDSLIATIAGAVFDVQYALGMDDGSTTLAHVTEIQNAVTAVINQAAVIVGYDPYTVTEPEILQIDQFRILVEALGAIFNGNPE